MWWVPVAAAAGAIIAGERQNSANKDMQHQANMANADQAQLNRDWQERMSNTAWQREAADMKAAGINPISKFGHGASTPGGAQANAQAARMENSLGAGVSSAMDAARFQREVGQADSQIALNKASEQVASTQEMLNVSSAGVARQEAIRKARDNNVKEGALGNMKKAVEIDAATDVTRAKMDQKAVVMDAVLKRAGNAVGVVSKAADVIKPRFGGGAGEQREKWKNRDEMKEDSRQEQFRQAEDLFK